FDDGSTIVSGDHYRITMDDDTVPVRFVNGEAKIKVYIYKADDYILKPGALTQDLDSSVFTIPQNLPKHIMLTLGTPGVDQDIREGLNPANFTPIQAIIGNTPSGLNVDSAINIAFHLTDAY